MSRRDADRMRRFWDDAAQRNAAYYVDTEMSWDSPDMADFFTKGRAIVAHGFADAAVQPAGRGCAVELGSGLGRNCQALAEHFDEVVGVDISASMVEQAQRLVTDEAVGAKVRFVVGDGNGLGVLPDDSADFALSFTVFQHMVSRELIEANIADVGRVLKPGGVFAFQWNNNDPRAWRRRRALARLHVRHDRYRRDAPEFLGTALDLDAVQKACAAGGLTIERTEDLGTLFAWAWARKVTPSP